MMLSHASRLRALAAALSLAACGARTGLRVPDASEISDASDVPDVPDVRDVPDVLDAPDVRDVPDVPDVMDAPDVRDVIEEAPVCIPGRFSLERRSAEVMFVVDRSGSMGYAIDGRRAFGDTPTRWRILRDAFAMALAPVDATLQFGAKFYPRTYDASQPLPVEVTCVTEPGVDLAPAIGNRASLLRIFDDTDPLGPTPTWDALDKTLRFLRARPGRGVSRAILLATDGGPNCSSVRPPVCRCTSSGPGACVDASESCLDDTRTLALIREAASPSSTTVQPIPVFVVGIDAPIESGPDFRDVLDAMAVAGGRPRRAPGRPAYYSIGSPQDLSEAFDAVLRSVQQCTFVTPSRPDDPDAIDVEVDGALRTRDTSRTNGWDWTDRTFGELTFFGPACEAAARTGARVQARVGCRDE